MSNEKRNGILAILALVAVFAVLACRHGIRLPQESESALTAEIRQALDGDTEAAGRYASLYAGMKHAVANDRSIKTTGDVSAKTDKAREVLGQPHLESLVPLTKREFAYLDSPKPEPLTDDLRRRTVESFGRLETAYRAVAKQKAPASVSDMLRQFADRMEARK